MKHMAIIAGLILYICGNCAPVYSENTLLFVAQDNYAPFQYYDQNGVPRGLDVEIIQHAAKIAKVTIQIKLVPWARAIEMARTGTADGVFGCGKVTEREQYLLFPEIPIRHSEIVFFANESFSGTIGSLQDVKNITVGCVNRYLVSQEFDTSSTIQKDITNSTEQLFQKLSINRHPLAVYNKIAGWYMINKTKAANIRILPYVIASYPAYLAFSKSSQNGIKGFDKFSLALEQMTRDGSMETITKKYLPKK